MFYSPALPVNPMLQYILSQVAPAIGLSIDNAQEKAWMIQQINKAAKELYDGRDLVNVEREIVFFLSGSDQQVSLPYYVDQVRAVRRHTTREKVPLRDMRPRYKSDGWSENLLTWREKWKSPLKRNITNEAPMTLSIPQAEASPFTVVITGSTPFSSRITEAVTFAAGEIEKVTVNQFTEIVGFMNLAPHTYNVTMKDADGVELSILPNVADRALYIVIQVIDSIAISLESPYVVEVLFKNAFLFMRNDYDEFVCPNYDDAISWQAIGNALAKHKPQEAALAFTKVRGILSDIGGDKMQSKEKTIQFEGGETAYPFGHAYGGRGIYPTVGLFPGADRL